MGGGRTWGKNKTNQTYLHATRRLSSRSHKNVCNSYLFHFYNSRLLSITYTPAETFCKQFRSVVASHLHVTCINSYWLPLTTKKFFKTNWGLIQLFCLWSSWYTNNSVLPDKPKTFLLIYWQFCITWPVLSYLTSLGLTWQFCRTSCWHTDK